VSLYAEHYLTVAGREKPHVTEATPRASRRWSPPPPSRPHPPRLAILPLAPLRARRVHLRCRQTGARQLEQAAAAIAVKSRHARDTAREQGSTGASESEMSKCRVRNPPVSARAQHRDKMPGQSSHRRLAQTLVDGAKPPRAQDRSLGRGGGVALGDLHDLLEAPRPQNSLVRVYQ